MMLSLSPEQFHAVMAHEMGHLSAKHSAFGAWIGRMQVSWRLILQELLDADNNGATIFIAFFSWFVPKLSIMGLALSRQNEFEANTLAAEAVGVKPLGDALVQTTLVIRGFSEKNVAHPIPHAVLLGWLNDALLERDHYADTHPCLADNLRHINHRADVPEPFTESAAQKYLGWHLIALAKGAGLNVREVTPSEMANNSTK
jgi:Zn-dependent protease with chaperone function